MSNLNSEPETSKISDLPSTQKLPSPTNVIQSPNQTTFESNQKDYKNLKSFRSKKQNITGVFDVKYNVEFIRYFLT